MAHRTSGTYILFMSFKGSVTIYTAVNQTFYFLNIIFNIVLINILHWPENVVKSLLNIQQHSLALGCARLRTSVLTVFVLSIPAVRDMNCTVCACILVLFTVCYIHVLHFNKEILFSVQLPGHMHVYSLNLHNCDLQPLASVRVTYQ